MALSVYEVVKGIYEAVKNKHHGAVDENGKKVEIGLKREEQPIVDQKVMDGFGIAMHGNVLMIKYHSVEPIRDLKQKKFEQEIERRIHEIKNYIVKEFNKITGTVLRLKEAGDISVLVETPNRVKIFVKGMMPFEVLNFKDQVDAVGAGTSEEKMKDILERNKKLMKGVKRPSNDTRGKVK
jgi:hypothetical protein